MSLCLMFASKKMASESLRFHWSDYMVFILSLVLSGSVGVVQGILDQIRSKKAKKEDSNAGERNISGWFSNF